ncbi:MAG: hypothetical protein IJ309_07640 [Clostridia bacterium]|nr:hypothetical protein [Clostridia bacterium]MBQ7907823.1 hypothetical protein [Clostridia bacterium]
MATFTNQAQLTYRDTVTNSNVAVGEILDVLSVSKTAVSNVYGANDTITYIVSIVNTGSVAISGLTLTDDLGAYEFGTGTLVPLSYTDGTIRYYIDGVLQPAPTVSGENQLVVNGISVPANGNATIVYEVSTNALAPLASGSSITNTATVSGTGVGPITDSEVVTVINAPILSITKSISPVPVNDNGTVTYTFVIQNTGNTPVVATDNSFITDLFDPILTDVTATFNGTAWTEGNEYNYNQATGLFESVAGSITVPAATYTQDTTSGAWSITPGTSTLVVTGTI